MENANKPVTDWGNTIYSGLGDLGMFKAVLCMIIALIVGLTLIVIGIYMIMYDDDNLYIRVKGSVVQPNCIKSSTTYDKNGKPMDNYKCDITVNYKINGTAYSNKMYLTGASTYINNEPIDLMVRKDDLNNVQLGTINKSSIGSIMIICSLILVSLAYLNYYMTSNYRIFAAAQGTATVVGLFR